MIPILEIAATKVHSPDGEAKLKNVISLKNAIANGSAAKLRLYKSRLEIECDQGRLITYSRDAASDLECFDMLKAFGVALDKRPPMVIVAALPHPISFAVDKSAFEKIRTTVEGWSRLQEGDQVEAIKDDFGRSFRKDERLLQKRLATLQTIGKPTTTLNLKAEGAAFLTNRRLLFFTSDPMNTVWNFIGWLVGLALFFLVGTVKIPDILFGIAIVVGLIVIVATIVANLLVLNRVLKSKDWDTWAYTHLHCRIDLRSLRAIRIEPGKPELVVETRNGTGWHIAIKTKAKKQSEAVEDFRRALVSTVECATGAIAQQVDQYCWAFGPPPGKLRATCPHCGVSPFTSLSHANKRTACPSCNEPFVVKAVAT